ncbi:hypothetical protein NMG60_11022704 [Bertholletia excelsa]
MFEPPHSYSGSFSWSQTAVLVQSTKVEAVRWTDSGNGIVTGGTEVVLWKKTSRCWEIAWKFKAELPQTLVSTTFSIEGPLATAPLNTSHTHECSSQASLLSKRVFVCYADGKFNYVKTELHHPMPVSMIQWRPLTERQWKLDAMHSLRNILLTCCLDGTVRLWSEINDGRVRRIGKNIHDQKTIIRSFHVAAVIEINQTLGGTLGFDIFVRWPTEIDCMIGAGKSANQYCYSGGPHDHAKTGNCEWLVAFGPHMLVSFWAVHCLDDIAPMRFPRVTLWKRQELMGSKKVISGLLLSKAVILRDELFGPPNLCSLVWLLPSNSICWLQFCTQMSTNVEEVPLDKSGKENLLLSSSGSVLNMDGHTGKILQISVHPYRRDIEIAASLDTDGLLLFWSLSTISNWVMGHPTLNPMWQLAGKIAIHESYPKYTALTWAPSVSDKDLILLMGHDKGIDCIMIDVSRNSEDEMVFQSLCTIPFTRGCGNGPSRIYSIPLPSSCKKNFSFNNFLLLAVWKKAFQALSWKITIHSCDWVRSSCNCTLDTGEDIRNSFWTFQSNFSDQRYIIAVDPCSSSLPDPHDKDEVTSFAVACPSISFQSEKQSWTEVCCNYSPYHIATGCSDGSLKLWRSALTKQLSSSCHWELVARLATHQGPVTLISVTGCSRKLATFSPAGPSSTSGTVCIWESVHLAGAGSFLLEDTLPFNEHVIALNWLTMGNGQLLLGICSQNEFCVYSERCSGAQPLMEPGKSLGGNIWLCIACSHTYPAIQDFVWGFTATAVIIHNSYISFLSQWTFLANNKHEAKCNSGVTKDHLLAYKHEPKDIHGTNYIAYGTNDSAESIEKDYNKELHSTVCMNMYMENDILSSTPSASLLQKYFSDALVAFCSMQDLAEKLCGSLPFYHPEVLLMNIYSGIGFFPW